MKKVSLKVCKNRIRKANEQSRMANFKLIYALFEKYPKIKSFTVNSEEHYDDNNYYKECSIGDINEESFDVTQYWLDEPDEGKENVIAKLVLLDLTFDDFSEFCDTILGWVDNDILLEFADSYKMLITKEIIEDKLLKKYY